VGRYADPFLNALMYSHRITVRAELWFNNALIGPLDVLGGSVTGDRSGSVRRTCSFAIDPSDLNNSAIAANLTPYGSRLKVFRGIRYSDGSVEEIQVFYGRLEAIDFSLQAVTVRGADLAADVMDARFLTTPMAPNQLPGAPTTMLNTIKALISEVHAGITFDTTGCPTDRPLKSGTGTGWSEERGDALDSMCTQFVNATGGGCEWYIDMVGKAHIHPLPAVITSGTQPVWIIDAGDVGVLVERNSTQDRGKTFNGAVVVSEPSGGITPATSYWIDSPLPPYNSNPNSPTTWGGPFGKVVAYYSGQQVDSTQGAFNLAKQLVLNAVSGIKNINVTCVPNPKLQLGAVVAVHSSATQIDGLYYVQALELPLDPETPMTLTLNSAIETTATGWHYAGLRAPEGATWQPSR
jgi:Domain of unknown function (DUF5047)